MNIGIASTELLLHRLLSPCPTCYLFSSTFGCWARKEFDVTPVIGSVIGECFYKVKRHIVSDGYRLAGSRILGNIVVFLVDPVNEVIGLFAGNPCRQRLPYSNAYPVEVSTTPWIRSVHGDMAYGFSVTCTF